MNIVRINRIKLNFQGNRAKMDQRKRKMPMANFGATWKRRPPSSGPLSGTKVCPTMPT